MFKNVSVISKSTQRWKYLPPAPLVEHRVWGPRKSWHKEDHLPINYEETPNIWNTEKIAKWDRRKKEIVVSNYEHSKLKEKALIQFGRFKRLFTNPTRMDAHHQLMLRNYQFQYFYANQGVHPNSMQYQRFITQFGHEALSTYLLIEKMNCGLLYNAKTVLNLANLKHDYKYNNEPCVWGENAKNMKVKDWKELKIVGIDARYSKLGYDGLQWVKRFKHCTYLNVSNAVYFDDHCMSRLHLLESGLEYLDLSGTNVTIRGLGYLRMLPNLKWLNLVNLDKQPDIEQYAGFIQEILPPHCYVNYSEEETIDAKNLLQSGVADIQPVDNILTGKDVEKLFGLPPPGQYLGTSRLEGRRKRKWLLDNYNQKHIVPIQKGKYYTKHAERFPPLF